MAAPSIHVRGVVLPDGVERDVYVHDGRITYQPVAGAKTLLTDAFVVPGLVDVHAHLSLHSPAGDDADPSERVRASARAQLDAGVLALREPGSPDRASAGIREDEGLPHVITAGRFLASPGSYFPGLALEVEPGELPAAAVAECRASGGWVKVIGDSPIGDHLHRTYDDETLAEAARQVHAAGGRIAVHCVLADTVDAVVRAGFDSLEHATFLQPDQVAEVARGDITWVPTLVIGPTVAALVRDLGYTADACRAVDSGLAAQGGVVAAAVDAGVRVLAGTDAGMVPHGLVSQEVRLLVSAGLSPETALGAASWAARTWLGLPLVEEGAPGDLVAFRTDPRDDASALADPAVVVRGGRLVRG